MKNLADIHDFVNSDMARVDEILNQKLHSNIALINQMRQHIIGAGGKRLRPLILILGAHTLGAENKHYQLMAAVVELIHAATLLHDDVVDRAKMRRGLQAAHQIWGNAASVLVGDFLYSRAFEMMVEADKMEIMRLLSKTTNAIAEGEVLQLLNRQNADVSEAVYFETIERKTARLFQASAEIAAILSDGSDAHRSALSDYGLNLGIGFQIIDDALDYRAAGGKTGKILGNDLGEGKATLPMIYAMAHTEGAEQKILRDAIIKATGEPSAAIIEILERADAFAYAQKKARHYAEKAKHALAELPDSKPKTALIRLGDFAVERTA